MCGVCKHVLCAKHCGVSFACQVLQASRSSAPLPTPRDCASLRAPKSQTKGDVPGRKRIWQGEKRAWALREFGQAGRAQTEFGQREMRFVSKTTGRLPSWGHTCRAASPTPPAPAGSKSTSPRCRPEALPSTASTVAKIVGQLEPSCRVQIARGALASRGAKARDEQQDGGQAHAMDGCRRWCARQASCA